MYLTQSNIQNGQPSRNLGSSNGDVLPVTTYFVRRVTGRYAVAVENCLVDDQLPLGSVKLTEERRKHGDWALTWKFMPRRIRIGQPHAPLHAAHPYPHARFTLPLGERRYLILEFVVMPAIASAADPNPSSIAHNGTDTTQTDISLLHTYTPAQIHHVMRLVGIVVGFALLVYIALVVLPKVVVRAMGCFVKKHEVDEHLAAPESPFSARPEPDEAKSETSTMRPLVLADRYPTSPSPTPSSFGDRIRNSLIIPTAVLNFHAKMSPTRRRATHAVVQSAISSPITQVPLSPTHDPVLRAAQLVVGAYPIPPASIAYTIPQPTPIVSKKIAWLPVPRHPRKPIKAALLLPPPSALVELRPTSVFRNDLRDDKLKKRGSTTASLEGDDELTKASKKRKQEREVKRREKERLRENTKSNAKRRPLAVRLGLRAEKATGTTAKGV
uniref:Uncharacterized protein n=1 Tax=Mycena chlorophos TaxID=658473 RepID=A0ABQ0LPU9_MYCCL|nr:predicted protein [Mycena chlorophos]